MPLAIGFDVYGTMVDPLAIAADLRRWLGERAEEFAEVWRRKQLEYALRRGLMRLYADFGTCSRQALEYADEKFGAGLDENDKQFLMDRSKEAPAFPDVIAGLEALRAQGHRLAAFSNGPAKTVETLLGRAGVLPHLHEVVSVDEVRTFKPAPEVYHHFRRRLGHPVEQTWLVSSNPWDVIGAKAAGLRAAWIQREPGKVFDPWDIEPDRIASDFQGLAEQLGKESTG